MADRLTGSDLREARGILGLNQREIAERINMSSDNWSKMERGQRVVSARTDRAVRKLLAQQASSVESRPEEIADAPIDAAASEWVAGPSDLPPLAEPPDADDDYVSISGGKAVQIGKLDHFARLELSLLTLLAGKDIVSIVSAPGGKSERHVSHQPGVADLLPPADRLALVDGAPQIAHAWVEWARTNKRVDAILSLMIVEGGFSGVVVATLPVALRILNNHGLDPLGWIGRQIAPPASPNGSGPVDVEAGNWDANADGSFGPEFG